MRRDGESPKENGYSRGIRERTLGGKPRVLGWPWVGRGCREKYEREESKAGGDSRLKTPLSSRELNSNVRVLRGERRVPTMGKRGETATDVCAFLSRSARLMAN